MNVENENTVSWINRLLELLHDSRDGYKECMEEVKDQQLKHWFMALSELRQHMIDELQELARNYNINYETAGSTLAAVHRLFVDLKSFLTGGDPQSIIEEIRRGENYTIKHYQDALNDDLPVELITVIRKQLEQLQTNLAQIVWRQETKVS